MSQQIQQDEWYKCVVMYKLDINVFPLFLQIVVDFLRREYGKNIKNFNYKIDFDDIFEIDYENNTIKEKNVVINLNDIDINEKSILEGLRLRQRIKVKMIRKFLVDKSVKDVLDKLKNTYSTWARFGLLRVEYSMIKGKLAIIFYSKHRGIYKTMKENIRKAKRYFLTNISMYANRITTEDLERELERGVLEEVRDIVIIS